jgi:sirohydrochlorin cobaltochelatase
VVAKTCHYWVDHMWFAQQREIAKLFGALAQTLPLLQVPFPDVDVPPDAAEIELFRNSVRELCGLEVSGYSHGWLGVECPSSNWAIWIMRSLVVKNVLARREDHTLFVALPDGSEPVRQRLVAAIGEIAALARKKGVA